MLALLASLAGGVLGFVPELIKIFRDKQDKKHELAILNLQMEQMKLGHIQRLEEINTSADIAEATAIYRTYKTGIDWIDAYTGTVRPTLAYAFFGLYAYFKYLQYTLLPANAAQFMALDILWTETDQAIFCGIISFFFGNRAMTKMRSR